MLSTPEIWQISPVRKAQKLTGQSRFDIQYGLTSIEFQDLTDEIEYPNQTLLINHNVHVSYI